MPVRRGDDQAPEADVTDLTPGDPGTPSPLHWSVAPNPDSVVLWRGSTAATDAMRAGEDPPSLTLEVHGWDCSCVPNCGCAAHRVLVYQYVPGAMVESEIHSDIVQEGFDHGHG